MAEQPGEPVPAASKLMEYDSDGEDGATTAEIKARTQNADQQRVRKLVGKVAKKKGIRDAKAYLPSIEGRGMVTYN